jgi:hypothetical protein
MDSSTKIEVTCQKCGKQYEVNPYRVKRTKYCSRKCQCAAIATRPVTWGKKIGAKIKGRKRPDLALWNKLNSKNGSDHPTWKGESAGYHSKHSWVLRCKGKAKICVDCGATKYIDWSNKDHKYSRNLDDYVARCKKCHQAYDKKLRKQKP